jgi:hypothetical protein
MPHMKKFNLFLQHFSTTKTILIVKHKKCSIINYWIKLKINKTPGQLNENKILITNACCSLLSQSPSLQLQSLNGVFVMTLKSELTVALVDIK